MGLESWQKPRILHGNSETSHGLRLGSNLDIMFSSPCIDSQNCLKGRFKWHIINPLYHILAVKAIVLPLFPVVFSFSLDSHIQLIASDHVKYKENLPKGSKRYRRQQVGELIIKLNKKRMIGLLPDLVEGKAFARKPVKHVEDKISKNISSFPSVPADFPLIQWYQRPGLHLRLVDSYSVYFATSTLGCTECSHWHWPQNSAEVKLVSWCLLTTLHNEQKFSGYQGSLYTKHHSGHEHDIFQSTELNTTSTQLTHANLSWFRPTRFAGFKHPQERVPQLCPNLTDEKPLLPR